MINIFYLLCVLLRGGNHTKPFITEMNKVINDAYSGIKTEERKNAKTVNKQKSIGDMLQELSAFLFERYAFRYNVLTEETEFALYNEANYRVIGKREMNGITLSARNEGIGCWDKDVNRLVYSDMVEEYHPFASYFDSLPEWDGKDRVGELARRVSDCELWVSSFGTWMRATAAGWMGLQSENGRANSVAPIIISREQGWGKSTFCRMLMPKELKRYFTENYDLNAPTSAEAKLADFGLINLDEFDKISVKRMAQLKNLMQMSALNIRKAYQRNIKAQHRIASFIGTSNRTDLLTDSTGSRRFVCVELTKPIDCDTPIDHAQLYAQLKAEIERGERYWFTSDEEAKIQENNRRYYRSTPEEDVFHSMFRFAERDEKDATIMTAAEIYKAMQKKNRAALRGTTIHAFSRLLPSMGRKIRTKYCNGYCVVRL
jgi:predicted P-loop ATPase